MTEPDKDARAQAALRDPEVQRLVREDPELSKYADRLPPAEEPNWEISDEELAKKSPAAVLARRMIRSQDPEADIQALFNQAEQMVDEFGPDPNYPDRPDHEDFRQLARIIQEMDEIAERVSNLNPKQSGLYQVLRSTGVDFNTMAYMAKQRAMRAEELLSEDDDGNPVPEHDRLIIMWLDAFAAGVLFAQEQAPSIAQLLDESIDGSRRQGK